MPKFSRWFPLRFARALIPLLPVVAAELYFEFSYRDSASDLMLNAVRGVALLLGYAFFSQLRPKWIAANGDLSGDTAIIKAASSSCVVAGGLCLYYAYEDWSDGLYRHAR